VKALKVCCRSFAMLTYVLVVFASNNSKAQETVGVTEINPTLLVFATSTGNVVASVGPDGVLLVGKPSVLSTPFIDKILKERTKSSVRYVDIYPESPTKSEGDAGWGKFGACVSMHENGLRRLGGEAMGAPGPLPERLRNLDVDRPRVSFSEVLAFDLNGDSVHIIHQKPGYSDADALTHFHVANLFYLGEAFPGDGYPRIDTAQGGTLEGLVGQLTWTDSKQRIVPARGSVTDGTSVRAFRDMITTVRDRVQRMINAGRTASQVRDAHPSSEFDAQWGHGRVTADEFVQEIYAALRK
jgi:cyclase